MASTQELLDEVEAAIRAQLSGKVAEWEEGGHKVRLLPMSQLLAMRKDLREQLADECGPILRPITEIDL